MYFFSQVPRKKPVPKGLSGDLASLGEAIRSDLPDLSFSLGQALAFVFFGDPSKRNHYFFVASCFRTHFKYSIEKPFSSVP